MTTEVENRLHGALAAHGLERLPDGYRLVHPGGAGVSTLRIVPVSEPSPVAAVAEIVADYQTAGLPAFHAAGLQRLNARAVYGAYEGVGPELRQRGRFSIYREEPGVHPAAQTILDAFGALLPLGRSTALSIRSPEEEERQRAHHAMPREWPAPVAEEALAGATRFLRERGFAAANDAQCAWVEVAVAGECPSRAIDPAAETALAQVNPGVVHPIAGIGYLATLTLPLPRAPADPAEVCRRLNALEMEQIDFPPRLGAWGLHGPDDLPGYRYFIPSRAPREGLHLTILWWLVLRALWIRERHWAAGEGITFERPPTA